MKLNIEDLNPGTWFYFDDTNPKEGRICLRIVNQQKRTEIIIER